MRGPGADQPVVAMKPGNAGGAKELNCLQKSGLSRPTSGSLGLPEVQAIPGPPSTSDGLAASPCREGSGTVCALAVRCPAQGWTIRAG